MPLDDEHAATQLAALAETTPDAFVTIDSDSRIQYVNPAIEDILGHAPEDLRGEPLTVLMSDDLAEGHLTGIERYLSTDERRLDWDNVELPGRHVDGHDVPLSISFSEFSLDGEQYFTGILRDITDRRRREERLERLSEVARALLDAGGLEAASERAVSAAADVLLLPNVTIALYDPEGGRLVSVAHAGPEGDPADGSGLLDGDRGLAWQAFASNEATLYGTGEDHVAFEKQTSLSCGLVVPLGEHGVLVACGTGSETVPEEDRRVADILAGTLEAVYARISREDDLRQRTSELESKNAQLQRVRRLNDVIRDITQALMAATSREEIKQVVCDRLASSEPYRFVWFGERDFATDEIVPVAWAGVEEGYLEATEVRAPDETAGESADVNPATHALRSGETNVRSDLQADPPFAPWRQAAMDRGYRAAIAVPITYRETVYGVLNCYAGDPDAFSEMEATVLSELGEMIGYGLNAMERYDALVSEDSVELEFVVRDDSNPLLTLLREADATFRLESIGPREGTAQRIFVAFEGLTGEKIRSFFGSAPSDVDLTVIRDRDDEVIVEATLPGDSLIGTLLERGAVPTEIRGTPTEGRVTVRISKSASVRDFLTLFESRYDDVELVARRESPEPVQSTEQFERTYVDKLTERQHEVLRTAYFAGFFEQPRVNSARDIAEMLDVSQPTVSRHIRSGEQTLFSMLFGDG